MNFMYKNTLYLLLLISLISCSSSGEDINYPESKKISFKENLHGYEITDDYRWLEDFTSDESIDWITRQNEFTKKYIEKNKYKKDLENYLNQIWESESISIPYKVEDKTFFYFNDGSFQQSKIQTLGLAGWPDGWLAPWLPGLLGWLACLLFTGKLAGSLACWLTC